jgi:uncharacterized Ntn-hydrolase superfamily protein
VTYSIVARDPATGDLGVAVQSHYFSVGSTVTWAEAGAGAVATQAMVRVEYGPDGLALMRDGRTAPEALATLVEADRGRAVRQVAMVDAAGNIAVHTGERCIEAAGHLIGDGYSVQANMMVDDTVVPAMQPAYEHATGDLAERMLAALDAAQEAGGDIRGQQSAAMLIVSGKRTDRPSDGRILELRVEDHPRPLEELRRLVEMHRAYRLVGDGDKALAAGDLDAATRLYREALDRSPENHELRFWAGITLFRAGHEADARSLLDAAFDGSPPLVELVRRLVPLGLVADEATATRIVGRT